MRPDYTSQDVAELVCVHPETVRRLAREGRMPGAYKVGSRWRFARERIEETRAQTARSAHYSSDTEPDMRRCPQCERRLPLTTTYWHRSCGSPTGFASWCKDCRKEKRQCHTSREPNWDSKKRRWTAEEERILREEYPTSSTAALAAKLHRSELAVRFRAHKFGISKVKPGTTRPELWLKAGEIAQAYRMGESMGALADTYDTSASTIRLILDEKDCSIRKVNHFARRRRLRIGNELYVQCIKCKKWKPRTIDYFWKQAHSADGLTPECIQCNRQAERDYLAAHPERREAKRRRTREHNRRMRRGLWAARWRLAAEKLFTEEKNDE